MSDTNYIALAGETGEAMTMTPMTLFVYGDAWKYHLLATCRIEIHSRPVIYTKIKVGKVSQHTLMIPTK